MIMKRLAMLFLFLFLIMQPSVVLAENWNITSPFGWRVHPVFGYWKYHGGVDFGIDYGVPVPVTQSGTVEYAAYDEGGGNMIRIDHGNGQETVYMHLSRFAITGGQNVTTGQIIGYVGSTGYSTGPHLHLGYYLNGELHDPVPYLLAMGWSITNIPSTDPFDEWAGYSNPGDMPWDFSGFYEFGKSLDDLISTFAEGCKSGLEALQEEAVHLLWILAVIDLAWLALQHTVGGNSITGNLWIPRLLKYGFILYLITNWGDIVNNIVTPLFSTGVSEFFGGTSTSANSFSKPGDVVSKGVHLIEPTFTYLSENAGTNILLCLTCAFLSLMILFFFLLIGIALVIYNVEFYVIAVFAVIALPFGLAGGLFSRIKAFPGGVIGSLIASAIKILIASIVITLIINILSPMQPVKYELTAYMKILVACFCFLLMIIRIPPHVTKFFKGHVNF